MKLPQDNLNYPIRILVGESSGSGFSIRHEQDVYVVTAKHVLYRHDPVTETSNLIAEEARIVCYPRTAAGIADAPRIYRLDLSAMFLAGDLKAHPSKDLVVLKLGSAEVTEARSRLNLLDSITVVQESAGDLVSYDMNASRRFADIETTNEVFVLGYPVSLSTSEMRQIDYDAPLARKGIIAGKNVNNQSIILDCPVYGGNSGGLVLEMNQVGLATHIHLIGVVVQFVPFVEQWRNTRFPELQNTNLQNSGYSVALPVDNIYDLINRIETDN
ncbi:MAG TPA: trypsin-like peptidase domain-containing protein [Candidatus Paceibacterota bacterium]|nr:trypsin-like peptidase domain-containing protein [Candidatus Paceibacterota bacterium]